MLPVRNSPSLQSRPASIQQNPAKSWEAPTSHFASAVGGDAFRLRHSGVLLSGSPGPHSCKEVHCAVTLKERFPERRAGHARHPRGQEPLTVTAEGKVC